MRKSILSQPADALPSGREWLDLQELASVEISSEDAQHPFENALPGGKGGGWVRGAALEGFELAHAVIDEALVQLLGEFVVIGDRKSVV